MKNMSPKWLSSVRGSFLRAADDLSIDIQNTDVSDKEACRILNDRIMMVRHELGCCLLSGPFSKHVLDFHYNPEFVSRNDNILILNSSQMIHHLLLSHSRWSTGSSPHTCPPLRLLSVTSCWAEAPTLWPPSPRPPTWTSSAPSWPSPPGACRGVRTPWPETSGTSTTNSKCRVVSVRGC